MVLRSLSDMFSNLPGSRYPRQMYFIILLRLVEPAAQSCALDRSTYSRRAQAKSTAEPNVYCNSLSRPGLRGFGAIRVIVARPPELREVPAEVQFEVARDAVTDITDLGTARLRTGQGQQWEEQVDARLDLASCRPPEPIDLGLRRGYRLTVERGHTPGERIDKRVELAIVQVTVHPAIALGDIGIEIV